MTFLTFPSLYVYFYVYYAKSKAEKNTIYTSFIFISSMFQPKKCNNVPKVSKKSKYLALPYSIFINKEFKFKHCFSNQ